MSVNKIVTYKLENGTSNNNSLVSPAVAVIGIYYSHQKMREGIQKTRAEFGQELSAEEAVKHLLKCTRWKRRTFRAIKYHIGGYEDDELRKLLVRAGTIRFHKDTETWGLISRNINVLEEECFTDNY